jgi:hypothetical protein
VTGYCADHDPIMAAGWVECPCGSRSWPVEAEWVTGTLVLAAFDPEHEPGCPHRGFPRVVLLDRSQDDLSIPPVDRPRRCRGIAATTGQRCRARARPGSGYCSSHGPAREEAA